MTEPARKQRNAARLCGAIVAVLLLWPIGHSMLVRRYDVDPWKLWGFAMYCTPHLSRVSLVDETDGPGRPISAEQLTDAAREELARFGDLRATLGTLYPPSGLARTVLDEHPEITRLVVITEVARLETASDRLIPTQRVYVMERPDS